MFVCDVCVYACANVCVVYVCVLVRACVCLSVSEHVRNCVLVGPCVCVRVRERGVYWQKVEGGSGSK